MSPGEIPSEVFSWMGGVAVAAGGVALGIQRALKSWAGNARDIERVHGEVDIVQLLRNELERMATQNDKLATLVNRLQAQVIELTSKNAKLNLQIQLLDFELKAMRGIHGMDEPRIEPT